MNPLLHLADSIRALPNALSGRGTFLLQSRFDTQFISEASTNTILLVGAILAAFVIVLVVVGVVNNRKRGSGGGSGSTRYGAHSFRRRAKNMGLSKSHVRTLEYVRQQYQVKNPMALLNNSRQLDFYLNKAIMDIEDQDASDDVKEAQKLTLFRIKQIIERNVQKGIAINSTRQLRSGQSISIATEDAKQYQTRVVAVLRDGIAAEAPQDEVGRQIRWGKATPLAVHFFRPNGDGYSFQTKVLGYNNYRGTLSAILQHSTKIQAAAQRRFRRKEIESPCYYFPVRVITMGSGRNKKKKAYVDKSKGTLGTIIEVSAGGCSLRTTRGLGLGSLVKVDFEPERGESVSAYGKVVNSRKESSYLTVMNVMFTRVTRKNLNRINAFIYEYGEGARL